MKPALELAVIYGSTRPGRLADVVAGWAIAEIERDGRFRVDAIDPARPETDDDDALGRRIGAADAVLVVTPEYNHSYPAPLKTLIDRLRGEWAEKPVAFVSYGGVSGGLRAVEHLRGVFAELDAHGLRETVSLANAWDLFDEAGRLKQPEGPRRALDRLLGRLGWWAHALKAARDADTGARRAA